VLIFRVAICAKRITASATIQETSIEFVTENFPIWKRGAALRERVSCSVGSAASATAGVIRAPITQRTTSLVRKQRCENIESALSKRKPDFAWRGDQPSQSRARLWALAAITKAAFPAMTSYFVGALSINGAGNATSPRLDSLATPVSQTSS